MLVSDTAPTYLGGLRVAHEVHCGEFGLCQGNDQLDQQEGEELHRSTINQKALRNDHSQNICIFNRKFVVKLVILKIR